MKLSDFNTEPLTLDVAQFALAITLDQMGKYEAFTAVVEFYGLYSTKYLSLFSSSQLEEEREELEMQLKAQRALLPNLIDYLMTNECLIGKDRNKTFNGVKYYSLSELDFPIDTDLLFEKTMQLLLTGKPNVL